ncbi:MAG: ABC transporter permease [Rhodospirillales bacterium]|nr:ABC transporter permease [Rhodospirillales bacterium]
MHAVALRMLIGDRAKYLGLIFSIAFATMLMSNQISIFIGVMQRTANQIIDVQEADLWVMDPRVRYVDEVEPLTDVQLYDVRGVKGVAWAVPLHKSVSLAHAGDSLIQNAILMGIDDATLTGAPTRMLLGSVTDLKRPDAIIIDRAGYGSIWPGEPLQVGKEIELNERRAVIVGICEARAPYVTFPIIYTKYTDAMKYSNRTRKQLSFVLVRAEPGEDISTLKERISKETGLAALTWNEFMWQTIGYYMKRTGIPVNFGITIILGFIVGAAVSGQTFYIFVLENLKQFGALKAIGVGNGTILTMILLQAGLIAVIGYALGIGLCAAFFEITSRIAVHLRGFALPWEVVAGTAGIVLIIAAIASLASIRRVMVLDPAIVFRG